MYKKIHIKQTIRIKKAHLDGKPDDGAAKHTGV